MRNRILSSAFAFLAACSLILATPHPADATVIMTLERVSDSVVNLTATGDIPLFNVPDTLRDKLNLVGAIASGNDTTTIDLTPNTLQFSGSGGTKNLLNGSLAFGTTEYVLDFDGNLQTGNTATGGVTIDLTSTSNTWASVGSSGDITWGPFDGGEIVGSWTMVPEPSTAALTALGLVGLAARRRRS